MWDSDSKEPCNICEYSRAKKMVHFDGMQEDLYLDKENMQSFSSIKTDELSMYENNSPLVFTENSPSHCSHVNRRPLEDHDSNSQDSGYGASYTGDNGKFLSYASPTTTNSFGANSMYSMEDEYLDFSDVEPLEKPNNLPEDFNKLINDPLAHSRVKPQERTSPKDTIIRPLFRRALSLQCTNTKITPVSSRVRTSLFKSGESEIRSSKRSEPPTELEISTGIKRSRIFDEDEADEEEASVPEAHPPLQRAFSATEESIMCALQRSSTEPDLIGDFTKIFSLPLTQSRHQDLKAITPSTLAQLMRGQYLETIASFKVIDCRYPYEFNGGHIDGAINIYTKEQCIELLDAKHVPYVSSLKRHILVFHCEFSSERGPNLYRYLRKEDRQKNENAYPNLFYPEIYLLEGGYKNFFEQYSEMCIPIAYKEMLHPDHEDDLRHFRQKSRTWNSDSRHRPHSGRNWKRLGLN
ncbi:M-phase inducer phosphatase-like [Anoplophora glabripennis]|uniref:M-phase inducer phosphatase-like n=1 Tax=Anoplophora glabripennis TaxID=217634 RepID=UPI00087407FF|nr:M-phase inducer phosphatase-like [Anoplophora glabripennis]